MPDKDKTGPIGQGPYTGRNIRGEQGFRKANMQCGNRSFGRGFGQGYRQHFNGIQSNETLAQEKTVLEQRIKIIDSQLIKE